MKNILETKIYLRYIGAEEMERKEEISNTEVTENIEDEGLLC